MMCFLKLFSGSPDLSVALLCRHHIYCGSLFSCHRNGSIYILDWMDLYYDVYESDRMCSSVCCCLFRTMMHFSQPMKMWSFSSFWSWMLN